MGSGVRASPFTLLVALGHYKVAGGALFFDDGTIYVSCSLVPCLAYTLPHILSILTHLIHVCNIGKQLEIEQAAYVAYESDHAMLRSMAMNTSYVLPTAWVRAVEV